MIWAGKLNAALSLIAAAVVLIAGGMYFSGVDGGIALIVGWTGIVLVLFARGFMALLDAFYRVFLNRPLIFDQRIEKAADGTMRVSE